MKKVLVLSLVLVMAFASTALASLNFGGHYTLTLDTTLKEEIGFEDLAPSSSLELQLNADYSQSGNWRFRGNLLNKSGANVIQRLNNYQLELWEGDIKVTFRQNRAIGWKDTPLRLIRLAEHGSNNDNAKTTASNGGMASARFEVPFGDVVKTTTDFYYGRRIMSVAEFKVNDYDLGLAYQHELIEDSADSLVGFGTFGINDITAKVAAGYSFVEDADLKDALAYGAEVAIPVDTNKLTLLYRGLGNEYNASNHDGGVNADSTEAKAVFDMANVSLEARYLQSNKSVDASANDLLSGTVTYWFGDKKPMSFGDMVNKLNSADHDADFFNANRWFQRVRTLDAPYLQLTVNQNTPKDQDAVLDVQARVASSIIKEKMWAISQANYNLDNKNYSGRVGLVYQVNDKFDVMPKFNYAFTNGATDDADTKTLDASIFGRYRFGNRQLGLEYLNKMAATGSDSLETTGQRVQAFLRVNF